MSNLLIFDSRRGRFGTVKPRQWGPLSAVRSSVFRNAERVGINPQSIKLLLPFWEGGGDVHDIVSGNHTAAGVNTPFDKDYLDAEYSSSGHGLVMDYAATVVPATNESGTLLLNLKFLTQESSNGHAYILAARNGSSGDRLYLHRYYSTAQLQIGFGSKYDINTSTVITPQTKYQMGIVWTPDTPSVVADGEIVTTVSQSGAGTGVTNFALGRISYLDTNTYYASCHFYQLLLFSEALPISQIALLDDAPYLLLQPNPTPFFFDVGGGTPVTIQKLLGSTSWTKIYGITPSKIMGVDNA